MNLFERTLVVSITLIIIVTILVMFIEGKDSLAPSIDDADKASILAEY